MYCTVCFLVSYIEQVRGLGYIKVSANVREEWDNLLKKCTANARLYRAMSSIVVHRSHRSTSYRKTTAQQVARMATVSACVCVGGGGGMYMYTGIG